MIASPDVSCFLRLEKWPLAKVFGNFMLKISFGELKLMIIEVHSRVP